MHEQSFIEDINARNPGIDVNMGLEPNQGLEELIERSELPDNPLGRDAMLELFKHAKVMTATELIWRKKKSLSTEKIANPYILGIMGTGGNEAVYSFEEKRVLDGKYWGKAYGELGVSMYTSHHTEQFMKKITDSGKPIVFLVPNNIFSYVDTMGITRNEIMWLLKNPSLAGNVFLVFGAYDMLLKTENIKNDHPKVSGALDPDDSQRYQQQKDIRIRDMVDWVNDVFNIDQLK